MIKFFRNIRRKLHRENRFTRYLIYAIGEIILVVIGILIALQINNWNETQKEIQASREFILEIREDLVKDTILLVGQIKFLEEQIKLDKKVLSEINYTLDDATLLNKSIDRNLRDFSLNDQAFTSMNNAGYVGLVGFEGLFKDIKDHYYITRGNFNRLRDWQISEAQKDQVEDLGLTQNYELSYAFYQELLGIDFLSDSLPELPNREIQSNYLIKKFQSIEGRNYLKYNYAKHLVLNRFWKMFLQFTIDLIEKIDSELTRSNA
ncbi:DUF6090 family protein [Gramella sp. KN1008]|uniref:DUF6090 family protein n=1 Tax=Gramella sp. KN1008 TaxID=2529298 RepID=UPI00103BB9F8|nr:DUF6090 family protein [Gramella sp. KN1008]TBW28306.1 hypothetical protein EZJ28_06050 [Gramella sp. KN1008]